MPAFPPPVYRWTRKRRRGITRSTTHRDARAIIAAAGLLLASPLAVAQDPVRPQPVPDPSNQPEPAPPPASPPVPAPAAPAATQTPAGATNPTNPAAVPPPAPAAGSSSALKPSDDDMFHFSDFKDPVELKLLVDAVRLNLGIPIIATDNGLEGQKILLPVGIDVPKSKVLRLLTSLLEIKGFTLSRGEAGIYLIHPIGEVQPTVGSSEFNTTRIIPTKGLRPTSLQNAIATLGIGPQNAPGGIPAKGSTALAYLDELGVILVTGTPRISGQIADLIDELASREDSIRPLRYELRNVAGSYARDRILDLINGGGTRGFRPSNPNQQPNQPVIPASNTGTSYLPFEERLTVDPQGNALYFRGRPDEVLKLESLLEIVDVPNSLKSTWYALGKAARAIAMEGQRQGLGDVTTEEGTGGNVDPQQHLLRQQLQLPGQQSGGAAGPGFVIYPDSGGFMYRGTDQQHARVAKLVQDLSELSSQELVVVEFYKLKHSKALKVAEILQNLLSNQLPTGNSTLVQGGQQPNRPGTTTIPPQRNQNDHRNQPEGSNSAATGAGGSLEAINGDQDTFVLGDEANNQVVVKAPKRLQPKFARLIDKLDLRRPQVYVDVKVVAITATDNFRLAFETQLLAGQFAFNTNFGLGTFGTAASGSTPGTNGDFQDRKDVVTSLLGATAAYIKSGYVPIIINALAQNVDTKILSSPQLLVDDNEEAKVDSVDRQPFTQTQQTSGNPLVTSFGGESEAGTKLRIKPQISEGDYLKLDFDVELSSFTGQAAAAGVPPPSQVNKISSKSVTVPSDMTIVVGGLEFEQHSDTVFKVPLLGDIPLIGYLFRDTRKDGRKGTLYVFITPTIMKDPTFADMRLNSRGPMQKVNLPEGLPKAEPVRIEIIEPGKSGAAMPGPSTGS